MDLRNINSFRAMVNLCTTESYSAPFQLPLMEKKKRELACALFERYSTIRGYTKDELRILSEIRADMIVYGSEFDNSLMSRIDEIEHKLVDT